MKVLVRIAALLIVVLLVFYYTDNRVKENKLLEGPIKQIASMPVANKGVGAPIPQTSRPEKGLSSLVGKTTEELVEVMGKPNRVEPSGYGYDWWVYFENVHCMVGVTKDGKVNQVYTSDISSVITPFEIGQNIKDIYRFTIVGSEIDISLGENVYTFSLNNEDMKTRLLIIYKDLYAQLYVDGIDGDLEAVRFIDPLTLVLHQPYDMTFTGDMIVSPVPSSTLQLEVDLTAERQIFELTNSYRSRHGLVELENDYRLKLIAQKHSEDMMLESYSAFDSEEPDNLTKRLKEAKINHLRAGENIASNYVDAIEVVHGWLNSPAHRNVLLEKHFTNIGIGVYGKYYTQSLIEVSEDDNRKR